jgi:hypothetical protein
MKKTKKMVTIVQRTGWIVRRVFEDACGNHHVRINGDWYSIEFLRSHGRTVELWQD